MKDLTQGSIVRHILIMAAPIAAGMIFQTLYFLVDLYFVAQLGDSAIAGVSAAGNATFVVLALTQVLGVGSVALISHAVGRKDQPDANLVFNQSIGLSALAGLVVLIGLFTLTHGYMESVSADEATIRSGELYLYWYAPGLALQFALVAMGSALRGTGIVQPTIAVQIISVLINAILAPVLIAGWGTGYPMGVAGAGLASSIALAAGVLLLWGYFKRLEHYVSFNRAQWRPQLAQWKRILNIGLPAGGEFALMFIYFGVIYWTIRDFGAEAQAGFGIGSRIMQSIFLPAMAIAFAAGPVAGQNFGARNAARVTDTFMKTALLSTVLMTAITLLAQWQPEFFVGIFTTEAEVIAVGALFLQLISLNFIAQGLIFTCSSMFQGLGNTRP
ncbi:MAG: MATE family efflux transporter, partial [Candidatus Obscuribacterales bacterium]|nr:MATE family efflux transporter [Steroidobacteraceae bacterium]